MVHIGVGYIIFLTPVSVNLFLEKTVSLNFYEWFDFACVESNVTPGSVMTFPCEVSLSVVVLTSGVLDLQTGPRANCLKSWTVTKRKNWPVGGGSLFAGNYEEFCLVTSVRRTVRQCRLQCFSDSRCCVPMRPMNLYYPSVFWRCMQ